MCLHSHAYFLQVPCRVLNQLSVYGIIKIGFMGRLQPFYTWGMCLMELMLLPPWVAHHNKVGQQYNRSAQRSGRQ